MPIKRPNIGDGGIVIIAARQPLRAERLEPLEVQVGGQPPVFQIGIGDRLKIACAYQSGSNMAISLRHFANKDVGARVETVVEVFANF